MGITPPIGFTYMSEALKYTCHKCHKWMPERTTGMHGYLEWHYCDKCMRKRT